MTDPTQSSSLWIFIRILDNRGLLNECGKAAKWVYDALKPIVVEKLAALDVAVTGALTSVVERAGDLLLLVKDNPVPILFVTLAGVSVLVQLGLERSGHKDAGRAAGAAGIAFAGGLGGWIAAPALAVPAVWPVAVGALLGFGLWNVVDFFRRRDVNVKIIIHCTDMKPLADECKV